MCSTDRGQLQERSLTDGAGSALRRAGDPMAIARGRLALHSESLARLHAAGQSAGYRDNSPASPAGDLSVWAQTAIPGRLVNTDC
jgi:hypothetical protein